MHEIIMKTLMGGVLSLLILMTVAIYIAFSAWFMDRFHFDAGVSHPWCVFLGLLVPPALILAAYTVGELII